MGEEKCRCCVVKSAAADVTLDVGTHSCPLTVGSHKSRTH